MVKKCLIIYASRTGNTEKIALLFKELFEQNNWVCDLLKVDRKIDVTKIPFDYSDYDFMCVGSPVFDSLPVEEVILALRKAPKEQSKKGILHEKIVFGDKKGIVFATYSGVHLGPKEASVALTWMELEMEHQKFKGIGNFCCPGRVTLPGMKKGEKLDMEACYHGDISDRPNEKDLTKARIFLEEVLEQIAVKHS